MTDITQEKNFGVYIKSIGIADKARNKDLGTALIKEVLKYVEGEEDAKYVYLDVLETNCSAIMLYEKNGFKGLFARKGFYPIGGKRYDTLVYCLCLDESKEKKH